MYLNLTGKPLTAVLRDLDVEDFEDQGTVESINMIMADANLTPDATELEHYAEQLTDLIVDDGFYYESQADGVVVLANARILQYLVEYLQGEDIEVLVLTENFAGYPALEYPESF